MRCQWHALSGRLIVSELIRTSYKHINQLKAGCNRIDGNMSQHRSFRISMISRTQLKVDIERGELEPGGKYKSQMIS